MPDDLDALRSRLEASVDVPAFERIEELADDARHRRRATRSAVVAGLAAAAVIAGVLVVTKLPGQGQMEEPPSAAKSHAATPDTLMSAQVVSKPGTVYKWSADQSLRAEVPIKEPNVGGPDRLTLRLTAVGDGGGEASRYDATVVKAAPGSWTVVDADSKSGSACDDLEISMRGAIAQVSAPATCSPQRTARLRWTVTALADGKSMMDPFEFVTLRPSGEMFIEPELSTDDPTLKSPFYR